MRRQLNTSLRAGERGSSRRTRRFYSGLVAGEIALACALLVASALLVRTVREMTATPLGVAADDVVTATIQLNRSTVDPSQSLPSSEVWRLIAATHGRVLKGIRAEPGVLAAGATNFLPLEEGWRVAFQVDGEPLAARPEDGPRIQIHSVSDGYFETMGARLAAGRAFQPTDDGGAPPVIVVNRAFADRYLGRGPAVGQPVRLFTTAIGPLGLNLKATETMSHDGLPYEVVGVVEDVRNAPLGQEVEPAIYLAAAQYPFSEHYLVVRAVDARTAAAAIHDALRQVAPAVPVGTLQSWGERFAARSAEPRLLMALLIFFGVMAALLAAAGIYGLFSWSVAMRRRELAIRLTLGAGPPRVARLVLGQSAALVGGGVAAGLAVVLAGRSALARVVYGISPTDAASAAAATAVLLAAATLACVPPVLRAMRVDPTEGLRAE
jgi:predicted permease